MFNAIGKVAAGVTPDLFVDTDYSKIQPKRPKSIDDVLLYETSSYTRRLVKPYGGNIQMGDVFLVQNSARFRGFGSTSRADIPAVALSDINKDGFVLIQPFNAVFNGHYCFMDEYHRELFHELKTTNFIFFKYGREAEMMRQERLQGVEQ